jgi:acetylornithine deacetylase/succinyl-diaminopimelate desuccinylase-like protein
VNSLPWKSRLGQFRDIYKELVETNTTLSAGDCTLAAKRMAARLKSAGYPDEDMRVFVPEGHPKEGGLLAVLHGSDPSAKAILMLAHVDVVEAKREDWTRDPLHPDRGRWILLWTRNERYEGPGRDLGR